MQRPQSLCGKFPCTCLCYRWQWCAAGRERQRFLASKYRLGNLLRAYGLEADNKARVARYRRKGDRLVDAATGEVVRHEPPALLVKALNEVGVEWLPPNQRGRGGNYGKTAWGVMGRFLPRREAGRVVKVVVGALAAFLLFCAVWGVVQGMNEERPVYSYDREQAQENAWGEYWGD